MNRYSSYKDSGVEWLGDIPEHWEVKKLKFLGNSIGGLTYSPNDVVGDTTKGKLVLRSSNIQNGKLSLLDNVYVNLEVSKKLTLKKGDILICSRNGSKHLIGKNICIDERTEGETFGAFMMIFRSANYQFLNHFFNSPIFTSQSGLFLTATINQLTSGTLNNFYIAIPPSIAEQTAIANYLDKKTAIVDTLIASKVQKINLLKENRTALINHVITKGLNPNVKLKDSGVEWIGEIPEHWEVGKLNFYCERIGDGLHSTPNYDDNGDFFFINGNNIKNRKIIFSDNTRKVNKEEFDKYFIKLSTKQTLLLSINGTIGNLSYYNDEKVILGKSVCYINLKTNNLKIDFLYWFLYCNSIQKYFQFELTGTTIFNLSLNTIRKCPLVIPIIQEQQQIVEYLNTHTQEIDELISLEEKKIVTLKEYRQALISEVVTGKIKVVN